MKQYNKGILENISLVINSNALNILHFQIYFIVYFVFEFFINI